jgi:hemolysin III
MQTLFRRRPFSPGEELANSVSHGIGFLGALIAAPFLLLEAFRHGGAGAIAGAVVFAGTAALLYLSSCIYHGLRPGKTKDFFEHLDHSAIFLLIAGTYTPFALNILSGFWGTLILLIIWPLALMGVILNLFRRSQPPIFSTLLYAGMGWFMLVAIHPLMQRAPRPALMLMLAGGLSYTCGLAFFYCRRLPYHHLAWHLSVLIGTVIHYIAVWRYAV